MSREVFVTNTNPKPYRDRYDGEEYVFPPNQAVVIPTDAAVHFFGYGKKDKTETLHRLGKSFHYDREENAFTDDPDGVRWLANFLFEEAVLQPASALKAALEGAQPPRAKLESLL